MSDRSNLLLRTYGIDEQQYDALLKEQSGCCYICDRVPRKFRLSVDHDHATGMVRGLLCSRCNQALAKFDDDHRMIERAVAYLQQAEWAFERLDHDEQIEWLLFRGRASGKGRRARITKARARAGFRWPRLVKG